MCLGTPHSHIPSTCTTKAWEEFTRWTVSSHVLQSAVRGKNCYWPLCPGSQHDQSWCTAKLKRTLFSTWVPERSDYTFSRWINHNQLQGRRLVEENLPFNSMPNGVQRDCNGHQKEPWTQRRCKVCKKTARYKRRKCGVRIHPDKGLHVVKRFTDKTNLCWKASWEAAQTCISTRSTCTQKLFTCFYPKC